MGELPETLGRYHLVRRLGEGRLFEAFVVESTGAAGVVKRACLRRVRPELARDRAFVRAFVGQLRSTMALAHGNVVQVFDFGQAAGSLFLVTELVEGPSLARLLGRLERRGGSLPPAVAVHLAAGLCAGLHHAHGAVPGFVHGDLRPENVLVSYEGQAKLVDFGLAASLEASGRAGPAAWTAFRAPEQLRGEAVDARTDVYGAGALLYTLLAGTPPVEGDAPAEAVLAGRQVPLEDRRPDLDPALAGVVMRALAPAPEDRWPSARLFQEALVEWARRAEGASEAEVGRLVRHLFAEELVAAGRGEEVPEGYVLDPGTSASPARRRTARVAAVVGVVALLGGLVFAVLRPRVDPWRVRVRSRPTGAKVVLDGRDTGRRTDLELEDLDRGRPHVLVLEKAGFDPSQVVLSPGQDTVAVVLAPSAAPPPTPAVAEAAAPVVPAKPARPKATITELAGGRLRIEADLKDLRLDPREAPALWFDVDPRRRHRLLARGNVQAAFLRTLSKVVWVALAADGRLLDTGFVSRTNPASLPRRTARVGVFGVDTKIENPTGDLGVELYSGKKRLEAVKVHPRGNFVSLFEAGLPSVRGLDNKRPYRIRNTSPRGTPPLFFVGAGHGMTTLVVDRDEMMHFVRPGGHSAVNYADQLYLFVPVADPHHPPAGRVSLLLEPAPPRQVLPVE